MHTKFKRHQKVILLIDPNPEYIEYSPEIEEENPDNLPQIKKGMLGEINILLPNGQYHVRILNKKGETIAFAPMDEENLEATD